MLQLHIMIGIELARLLKEAVENYSRLHGVTKNKSAFVRDAIMHYSSVVAEELKAKEAVQ